MTNTQTEAVKERTDYLIGLLITDTLERQAVVDNILEDVISDIEECADWKLLDGGEWCEDDIDFAVSRILQKRILG